MSTVNTVYLNTPKSFIAYLMERTLSKSLISATHRKIKNCLILVKARITVGRFFVTSCKYFTLA